MSLYTLRDGSNIILEHIAEIGPLVNNKAIDLCFFDIHFIGGHTKRIKGGMFYMGDSTFVFSQDVIAVREVLISML